MPLPHPLPEPIVELIARRFRVIGEPMRIRILDRLRDGEATVAELTESLGTSQQNVSKHLGVLHEAGILGRRKQGTHTIYAIADESVLGLCEQVCGGLQRQFSTSRSSSEGRCDELLTPLSHRVLFGLAGTMRSIVLAVTVSPWFLLLGVFVAANQWLYALVGACPSSSSATPCFSREVTR